MTTCEAFGFFDGLMMPCIKPCIKAFSNLTLKLSWNCPMTQITQACLSLLGSSGPIYHKTLSLHYGVRKSSDGHTPNSGDGLSAPF